LSVFRFLLAAAALAAGSAALLTAGAAAAGTAAAAGASAAGASTLGASTSNHSFSAMPWWSALRLSEFLAKLTNFAFFRGRLSYARSHSAYCFSSPAQPSRAHRVGRRAHRVGGAGPAVRLGGRTWSRLQALLNAIRPSLLLDLALVLLGLVELALVPLGLTHARHVLLVGLTVKLLAAVHARKLPAALAAPGVLVHHVFLERLAAGIADEEHHPGRSDCAERVKTKLITGEKRRETGRHEIR
jgi:hypothetical protein